MKKGETAITHSRFVFFLLVILVYTVFRRTTLWGGASRLGACGWLSPARARGLGRHAFQAWVSIARMCLVRVVSFLNTLPCNKRTRTILLAWRLTLCICVGQAAQCYVKGNLGSCLVFFPFIFNPVLGRACQPFGAAPHSLVRLLRPFLRFSSFTLVKSLDFCRSFV